MSPSRHRNGQTAIEFLAMLILVMLAFAAFYTMFGEKQLQLREEQHAAYAEAVADRIAFELNVALTQGDGFTRNVTLPAAIIGEPYTVTVDQETVQVSWESRSAFAGTAVDSVVGSFVSGKNTIRNEGGELHVN